MSQKIEIKNNRGLSAGSISFDESGERLSVRRTAAGFHINIPAQISLNLAAKGEPLSMVCGLHGELFANDQSGVAFDIGQVRDERWYTSAYRQGETGQQVDYQVNLNWRGTYSELAAYEKIRGGRFPEFHIQLRGELCHIIYYPDKSNQGYRSEPQSIYGEARVIYPKELWVARLHSLGVMETVLLEVPLPSTPPAPWDEVWKALVAARNALEQGGTNGWKGCVAEVRVGLERWKEIEEEDLTQKDSRARTKEQRLDLLRANLLNCAHFWMHNASEKCSREDALLMLSTFSTLLLERNP
jgi:hypothetical protein